MVAWADPPPFVSRDNNFKAVFPAPVKVAHPRSEQITYGCAPSDKRRDWEAISVLKGDLRKPPLAALNYLVSEGVIKAHPGKIKNILLDKLPGIEVSGLDEKGYPFGLRIFTTTEATYVLMSCNMDLARTQAFLKSFELTTPAPKVTPPKRKKQK